MKKEIITKLHKSFEEAAYQEDGVEYWLARELQLLLDYTEWRNFTQVIEKAKIACKIAGQPVLHHFVDVNKTIPMPKADFLPTITVKAKDLATEITNFNVKKVDLKGEDQITGEHVKNNQDVRTLLAKSGIVPENLPREEDIKKLERRVKADDKKIPTNTKMLKSKKKNS